MQFMKQVLPKLCSPRNPTKRERERERDTHTHNESVSVVIIEGMNEDVVKKTITNG